MFLFLSFYIVRRLLESVYIFYRMFILGKDRLVCVVRREWRSCFRGIFQIVFEEYCDYFGYFSYIYLIFQ